MKKYCFDFKFQMEELCVNPQQLNIYYLPLLVPAHNHSLNCYELHYILSGTGTVKVDDVTYNLKKGNIYMTGPNLVHTQTSNPDDMIVEYCLYMNCSLKSEKSVFAPFAETVFWICDQNAVLSRSLDGLMEELSNVREDTQIACETYLRQFIVDMNRCYKNDRKKIIAAQLPAVRQYTSARYPQLDDAFAFELDTLTLGDVAAILHMSERQTQRFLKTYSGRTFSELRTNARMETAAQMLVNTDESVSKISETVGFSSIEHFSNAFKARYGVAPSIYRKRNQ